MKHPYVLSDDERKTLSSLPDVEYISSNREMFNRNSIANKEQQNFINSRSIGSMTTLYRRFMPSSYDDFYKKYLADGVYGNYDIASLKGDVDHGRTMEDLWNAANIFYNRLHRKDKTFIVSPIDCYWNIINHAIFETFNGAAYERYVIDFYTKHYDLYGWFTDPELDIHGGVDIVLKNKEGDPAYCFIQVKPISTFIGNGNGSLVHDRAVFYNKQAYLDAKFISVGLNDRVRPIQYMMYKKMTDDGPLFLLNKNGLPFFTINELCDTNGMVIIDVSKLQSSTLKNIHKIK